MQSYVDNEKNRLTHIVSTYVASDLFLNQNDEGRSRYLEGVKQTNPEFSAKIDQAYIGTILGLNPNLMRQLREVFMTKQFQVANDLERQLMIDRLMQEPSVSEGRLRFPRKAVELIAKQETVDRPNSTFNVMQQVREVFRSKMFSDFSPEDKQRYVNLMVQQPMLTQAGINREDLLKAWNEIEANTRAINSITADPLFLIMSRLDPKSVLRTCETTNQFARLCRNPNLFSALMRIHYPNSFETANPREQYKAITMDLETTYRMRRKHVDSPGDMIGDYWTTFENPIQYGKTQYPWNIPRFKFKHLSFNDYDILLGPGYVPLRLEYIRNEVNRARGSPTPYPQLQSSVTKLLNLSRDELGKLHEAGKLTASMIEDDKPEDYRQDHDVEVVFSIKGYPIPHGSTARLLILQSHSADIEDKVELFKSKEALAESFIRKEYPELLRVLLEEFNDNLDEDSELARRLDYEGTTAELNIAMILSSPEWKADILQRGLPYPFTPENVYRYIMENDQLQAHPLSERNSWLFREVTF